MLGFLGHSAAFGCNKCFKVFSDHVNGFKDYFGYDENWVRRDGFMHRHHIDEIAKEKNKLECLLLKINMEHATPYVWLCLISSSILQLLMHNKFLGTGKQMFQQWLQNNLLTKQSLETVEIQISKFCVQSGVGKVPTQI